MQDRITIEAEKKLPLFIVVFLKFISGQDKSIIFIWNFPKIASQPLRQKTAKTEKSPTVVGLTPLSRCVSQFDDKLASLSTKSPKNTQHQKFPQILSPGQKNFQKVFSYLLCLSFSTIRLQRDTFEFVVVLWTRRICVTKWSVWLIRLLHVCDSQVSGFAFLRLTRFQNGLKMSESFDIDQLQVSAAKIFSCGTQSAGNSRNHSRKQKHSASGMVICGI